MSRDRSALAFFAFALAGAVVGCSSAEPADAPEGSEAALTPTGPFYVVGSFDGSQGFSFWTRTLGLARTLSRETGRPVHFTYFVNGAHFKRLLPAESSKSECGAAVTEPEIRARFALAQQAIGEGHEIANHSMFHTNGGEWWNGEWSDDIGQMDAIVSSNLFEPIRDAAGALVFPRWVARGSGRALGAACTTDADCDSGMCLGMAEGKAFCSKECNYDDACPASFACGGGPWRSTFAWGDATIKDVCVPLPDVPVTHEGIVLFDATGAPNPDAIDTSPTRDTPGRPLKPYKMVGLRAPYLAMPYGTPPGSRSGAIAAPLWSALGRKGYRYSSSQGAKIGDEQQRNAGGMRGLWELPVVPAVPERPMAADGVYRKPPGAFSPLTGSGSIPASTMRADYKRGILARYAKRGKGTRHLGLLAHFSPWETDDLGDRKCAPHGFEGLRWESRCGESYFNAFADSIEWAARGCPDDGGQKQCPDVVVGSYLDLLPVLDQDALR
jgi:hypothetical protein